jgi:hypothetical protein
MSGVGARTTSAVSMLPVSSAVSWKSRLDDVPTDEARLLPSVISEMKLVPIPRRKISTASPEV